MEDTILFLSAFDANVGIFSALLGAEDAIISDELNHASIIDGIRLCKAKCYRYPNNNMEVLKTQLIAAREAGAQKLLIVIDGVFSMEGTYADLHTICDLADEFNAIVMVDDSHATGFIGEKGRGTHERANLIGRIDIITSTLGKCLGGACGGFISSSKGIIAAIRKNARPYTFSSTLPPFVCAASIHILDELMTSSQRRDRLNENTMFYREKLVEYGFELPSEDVHPIVPVLFYDEEDTFQANRFMWEQGIYLSPIVYPVVPQGLARIRTQVTSAHTKEELEYTVKCFAQARDMLRKGH